MVMELCGKSINDLHKQCKFKFSLKTVCMLAVQFLERIQMLHENHYLHRDIKPDNFIMGGSAQTSHLVHMIDFGLAKAYIDKKTCQHILPSGNKPMTGTARYASVNAHLGKEQSRRDDLEAIGYMLVYLLKGSLPWQNQPTQGNKSEKYKAIKEKKIAILPEQLCRGIPEEF
jgi:serine/threonine protein kinase